MSPKFFQKPYRTTKSTDRTFKKFNIPKKYTDREYPIKAEVKL